MRRVVAVFLALILLACGAPLYAAPEHSRVMIAGQVFTVEIAKTEPTRERGLMYRTRLAADHGMLFIYPDAQVRLFWMKNTLIPLDILFFDAHKRLINVAADTPPCKTPECPTYGSSAPAQYVLELKAGTARKFGITAGSRFKLLP